MKKTLLILLLSCIAFISARADLIYYEGFNYVNGYIGTGSTNLWLRQSGTGNDSLVNNHKLEVSTSSGVGVPPAPARTDDMNRPFAAAYTNGLTNICVSFTLNMTYLPASNATYF